MPASDVFRFLLTAPCQVLQAKVPNRPVSGTRPSSRQRLPSRQKVVRQVPRQRLLKSAGMMSQKASCPSPRQGKSPVRLRKAFGFPCPAPCSGNRLYPSHAVSKRRTLQHNPHILCVRLSDVRLTFPAFRKPKTPRQDPSIVI